MAIEELLPQSRKKTLLVLDEGRYNWEVCFEMYPHPFLDFQILCKQAHKRDDFLYHLKQVGSQKGIDFLMILLHGNSDAVCFPDNSAITKEDIKCGCLEGYSKYFKKTSKNNCYLGACYTAQAPQDSFAELFFRALQINGEAPITAGLPFFPTFGNDFRVTEDFGKGRIAVALNDEPLRFRYFGYQ